MCGIAARRSLTITPATLLYYSSTILANTHSQQGVGGATALGASRSVGSLTHTQSFNNDCAGLVKVIDVLEELCTQLEI